MSTVTDTNHDETKELKAGDFIGGCYILFQCIGQDARSSVWTCRHKDLDGGLLAIRILNPKLVGDQTACARFHREVVASYTVNHPNVVRTHEFVNDGVHVAYTMEFMEYGNLKSLLDTGELLEIEDILLIATQIASGVQGVHDAGLIHRNIKPGNVFFTEEGEVKIGDFGIARSDGGPKLTNDGEILGTVGYTSPEYLKTGEVDLRSDVYAIGLLLYEMITGSYPYYSPNPVEAIRLRVMTDPVSPTELRPECPLELSQIVLKAMAREPEERYQSAAEILAELESLGVVAGLHSMNTKFRERKESFWRKIPTPYVDLGTGYEGDEASKISNLRDRVGTDLARRRFLFWGFIATLCCLLGVMLSFLVAKDPLTKSTLAEVEKKIKDARTKVFDSTQSKPEAPAQAVLQAPQDTTTRLYTVVPGDTVHRIALKFSVSADALMKENNIEDPRKLPVGAQLRVPE